MISKSRGRSLRNLNLFTRGLWQARKLLFIRGLWLTYILQKNAEYWLWSQDWEISQDSVRKPFSKTSIKHKLHELKTCRSSSPGGYIELTDGTMPISCEDGTLPPDSAILKWSELILEASIKMDAAWTLQSFTGSTSRRLGTLISNSIIHVGQWINGLRTPNERKSEFGRGRSTYSCLKIFLYTCINLLRLNSLRHKDMLTLEWSLYTGCSGLSLALFTRVLGWSPEQIEVVSTSLHDLLRRRKIVYNFHFYSGRFADYI